MLFDPKWNKPSLQGFRQWLLVQDPNVQFNYYNCHTCAVGRYLASMCIDWHHAPDKEMRSYLDGFALTATMVAAMNLRPPTYGDVLRQIETAIPLLALAI